MCLPVAHDSVILAHVHVDFLTLACLRDDLDSLLGARVQHIVLPDHLSVGLELYADTRHYLFLSAHPQHARVSLLTDRLRRGQDVETPLLLLLRKWVRGARLADVTQPAWERVLVFHFEGPMGRCQMVAEIMDRYSNLVLVGPEGRVLDAAKRIGHDVNRCRVTLPGQPYQRPPQPVHRLPPVGVDWPALLAGAPPEQALHHVLTGRLMGVSPTLAREVAARAAGNPLIPASAADPVAVGQALGQILASLDSGLWEPHVALDDQGAVMAFAPYRPRQFVRVERAASISAAMTCYFSHRPVPDAYAAARREVRAAIDAAIQRVRHALARLQHELPDDGEVERLRESGELLLAYQHQVAPGADRLTVPDYHGDMSSIPLDSSLTPLENAHEYFRRYAKARRAAEGVPARIEQFDGDTAYLEQLSTDLALAETRPEIDAVRDALAAAGWMRRTRQHDVPVGGPAKAVVDGFTIYVGRNARQNEELTFKLAAPDDLWLHVCGRPGPHVIIKSGGRDVPQNVLEHAARQAARRAANAGSGARSSAEWLEASAVDVTQRRFVRRAPGKHPGMVTYRNERTLWVKSTLHSGRKGAIDPQIPADERLGVPVGEGAG